MGCTESTHTVAPIPEPTGPPIDPMQSEGDIVEAIMNDPHIHFFQKKIE